MTRKLLKNDNGGQTWQFSVSSTDAGVVVDTLEKHTGLSKRKLKDAMLKGAVWLQRGRGKRKRLRRATTLLQAGDVLSLYYAPELLERNPPGGIRLWHCREYSVWYKPAGLLSQGNDYGDHASLLRQAELADPKRKPVYLIHRLDREASGLMLIAHTQGAAHQLSQIFQQQQVTKEYEVRVVGKLSSPQGEIKQALDGKSALTRYTLQQYDAETNTSVLRVRIETGRTHQIRRHLAMLGHPVLGDPRYGKGNKSMAGLQLTAARLAFTCPVTREAREFVLAQLLPEAKQS